MLSRRESHGCLRGDGLSSRLCSRLPLTRQPLRLGYLRWRHAPCDVVSIFYRILVALRRRQVEPRVRA
jgi:hypothetical protein